MRSDVVGISGVPLSSLRRFIVMLAMLCFWLPALSVADNYLSELEAEAELSAGGATEDDELPPRSGAIGSPAAHNSAEMASFDRELRLERPHVHTFYRRLSDAEKMQVVKQFMKDSENISKAANQVLDLYFQKK